MPDLRKLYSHAATILPVKDIQASIQFYRDLLDFDLTFTWGAPVDYAILKGGDQITIHLTESTNVEVSNQNHIKIYCFVHDVDALYEAFLARKVQVHTPIGDRDYRMRDFDISDPDGHLISFGKGM